MSKYLSFDGEAYCPIHKSSSLRATIEREAKNKGISLEYDDQGKIIALQRV